MAYPLEANLDKVEQVRRLFASVEYFNDLAHEVYTELAAIAEPCHCAAQQVIYIEGDEARFIFVIAEGWVKATRTTREGREKALAFMQPGEMFGNLAALAEDVYPATVTALEAVTLWKLPVEKFASLVLRHPDLALAVIRYMDSRVKYFVGLVEDLSLRNVEARLANTLLRHARVQGGQLLVPRRPWTTFDEMAVRLGTVRDVLSRGLKTLEAEGLLKVEKHAIVLLNAEGLARRGRL
jgi:CRP/FNR family transcriptional regulator